MAGLSDPDTQTLCLVSIHALAWRPVLRAHVRNLPWLVEGLWLARIFTRTHGTHDHTQHISCGSRAARTATTDRNRLSRPPRTCRHPPLNSGVLKPMLALAAAARSPTVVLLTHCALRRPGVGVKVRGKKTLMLRLGIGSATHSILRWRFNEPHFDAILRAAKTEHLRACAEGQTPPTPATQSSPRRYAPFRAPRSLPDLQRSSHPAANTSQLQHSNPRVMPGLFVWVSCFVRTCNALFCNSSRTTNSSVLLCSARTTITPCSASRSVSALRAKAPKQSMLTKPKQVNNKITRIRTH